MHSRVTTILFLSALVVVLSLALQDKPRTAEFVTSEHQPQSPSTSQPVFDRSLLFQKAPTPSVHSGTLVQLPGGDLLAAWFGGKREGAGDVAIWGSRWAGDDWSEPFIITDRAASEQELGRSLRKLGNPVLHVDSQQRLWLFYVTVSIGGWSTSSISFKRSLDGGLSWEPAHRLVTSPLANLSTLVRNRPLAMRGGNIALPVYHELAAKFGEVLHIDPDGRVLNKVRITSGRSAIQPSLVARDAQHVVALMRSVSPGPSQILLSRSANGGTSWSPMQATRLPNPDASVAALGTPDGGLLLAYNDSHRARAQLSLGYSKDGIHWRKLTDLENGGVREEYSYPYLVRSANGDYHLIYTWRRTHMAHVRFNQAWLESQL
ncbi:MAG: sialidase family protein [Halieaceae bacterium]|jgi:predicted neuraminidase|nr:sialidase family protein [Halieaceae bacterium]